MFLRELRPKKDGKEHSYSSLVETVRTPQGPRQRTLCYLGELNTSAQARWQKTIAVFNEQDESRQLKLFPSEVEPPENDPDVARVLLKKVRLERPRQFGNCFPALELWKRLGLEEFWQSRLDEEAAEVPWSRVAAVLAINRLCAPGSELSIEERWYPTTPAREITPLVSIAFPQTGPGRHPNLRFRSSIPRPPVPLSTLLLPPRSDRRKTRRQNGVAAPFL